MATRFPSRHTFIAACIVVLLCGSAHLMAVIKSAFIVPPTPEETRIADVLKADKMQMGPFNATMWGAVQILSFSFSILLYQAGVLSLLAFRPAHTAGRLRLLTFFNILFAAILAAVSLYYQFPPPLLFAVVITVLFVISFIHQG